MARATFELEGVRLTQAVVEELLNDLRPHSIAGLESELEFFIDEVTRPQGPGLLTREESEAEIAALREAISNGGEPASIDLGVVVDRDGIEHEWDTDGTGPPRLDALDDSGRAKELRIRTVGGSERGAEVVLMQWGSSTDVSIEAPASHIAAIRELVRTRLEATIAPTPPAPVFEFPPLKVFIGHGGDLQWRAVEAIVKAAGYEPVAFESDSRVGYQTLHVVESMISSADVAVIVMTAADRLEGGQMLARPNVIHELGFAQGRLGVQRTITVLEKGTEEPSNIHGWIQVRYEPGEVYTIGDDLRAALALRDRARRGL